MHTLKFPLFYYCFQNWLERINPHMILKLSVNNTIMLYHMNLMINQTERTSRELF